MFNGQGGQWAQMGKELMEQYPSFRNDIKRMDEYLSRLEDGPRWTLEGIVIDDSHKPPTLRKSLAHYFTS